MNISVGHYTDNENGTGTTVFIFKNRARVGIDIRGSNTATFNTPAFDSKAEMDSLHAIVLTGGSTYGLESCIGVMEALEEQGIGNKTRVACIPAVTGAVIYDLEQGNPKVRPNKESGKIAVAKAARSNSSEGNIGVGTGATTGKWFLGEPKKGGFFMSSTQLPGGGEVRAYVVTNAVGDIVESKNLSDLQNRFESLNKYPDVMVGVRDMKAIGPKGANTTLAVIATNVDLSKTELQKVAEFAHDGIARAIYPIHTNLDGDVIFAISVGPKKKLQLPRLARLDIIGLAAADTLQRAILKSSIDN